MSQSLDSPPVMVETPAALKAVLDRLKTQSLIAIDTESNSLYAYREQVCLIQISDPDTDYIVDTLALDDLSELGEIFVNPRQEKIFHGADYDISTLRRDYGFEFTNIFDTMIASRILGIPHYGLASLLSERLGVHLNKKMQKYNWGRRPLDSEAVAYARLDTHYLITLRNQLLDELRRAGREREAREMFERVAQTTWNRKPFSPDDFWRVKGARTLDDEGRGILKALVVMREERARRQNRPTFKVLADHVLVEISRRKPERVGDLKHIPGLSERQIRSMGRQILRAAQVGRKDPQPWSSRPMRPRRPNHNHVTERYEQLRGWRKKRAEDRGVEPDVIISNHLLWEIAEREPADLKSLAAIDGVGRHQVETYGEEILAIIRQA